MPSTCIMVNCTSRAGKGLLSFFSIPTPLQHRFLVHKNELSKKRKDAWLKAINRIDLTEKMIRNGKICQRHFISGKPALLEDTENPDWTPSLHLGYNETSVKEETENVVKVKKRKSRKRLRPDIEIEQLVKVSVSKEGSVNLIICK